ncbi:radical SAM protein [Treponema sp. OMZ 840]|uniref:radical SAM protein n=1 Tax=Treponema sp. OMZ 840 TaxID=244313 RepID=UPI003D915878
MNVFYNADTHSALQKNAPHADVLRADVPHSGITYIPSKAYVSCSLCPRNCGVNRAAGATGFCNESAELKIASACLHFGEEPPVTARGGSGTIFISGCNLGCSFCQNYQISREGMGRAVSTDEFVSICSALESAGAENINIVTGSHAIPAIAEGIGAAKKAGLGIPVCWNSSAYESLEALEMLAGLADIWLPDLKTLNSAMSLSLFGIKDYGKTAKSAIKRMIELSALQFTDSTPEKMLSGVIIRHLVLPGCLQNTRQVLDWLKEHADGKACISLMSQYTPVRTHTGRDKNRTQPVFPDRFINEKEFDQIQSLIFEYDFEHLFYQELENDDSWLPDFNRTQPFSNALAKPLWHWKNGFTNRQL